MNPFLSFSDYEEFIYTLQQKYPSITISYLELYQRSKLSAILQGELIFANGFRLVIRERLSCDDTVMIEGYGYELWHDSEKIAGMTHNPTPMTQLLPVRILITNISHLI